MSVLDDFIAVDPVGRDFVDLYGTKRWSDAEVRTRTEEILGGYYNIEDQRIMARKADIYQMSRLAVLLPDPEMPLPPYPLSLAEKQQLLAFGTTSIMCGILKDVMIARAQRVNLALDYEGVRDWMATLAPLVEDEPDPDADLRAQLQAALDAHTPETVAFVAERDAILRPPPPEPDPEQEPEV